MSGDAERQPHLFQVAEHGLVLFIGEIAEPVSRLSIAPFPRPQLPHSSPCTLLRTIVPHAHKPFRSLTGYPQPSPPSHCFANPLFG